MTKLSHLFIMFLTISIIGSSSRLSAQNENSLNELRIKTLPFTLKKLNNPLNIEIKEDSILSITANENTNLFNSPSGKGDKQNAPMVLFHPDSNFVLKAKVKAELKEVYDVAALVIYQDKDLWAKLCFENSADKEAMVVSVVTRKHSDDCNSVKLNNNYVYLSVVKKGKEFSFHYSKDNLKWELVRHFRLDIAEENLYIGFTVHCYVSKKFSAEFSDISYSTEEIKNLRRFK